MKKIFPFTAMLVIISFYYYPSQAKSIKMTGNRMPEINRLGSNSCHSVSDTTPSPFSRVISAFAKAAKDNPNDTSSADVTIKALGNLMGGGGVSAADSASAIKSFIAANGGIGYYYQTVTTTASKQMGTHNDTSASYYTSGGEGRREMNLTGMMGVKGGNELVVLSHANEVRYSLTVDASNKTYSLNVIDTSLKNSRSENYQVTKIGNETIQGFNCIHSKLVSTSGSGMFKSTSTMDIWTSASVPGYALLKKAMTIRNVTPKMMQALEQAGSGGYFVKINMQNKDFSMNMELIKAEQKNFSSSLFRIPAGYTESKQNMIGHMMGAKE